MIAGLMQRFRLWQAKKGGLHIAADCRLNGSTNWGTEPYLIGIGPRVTISGSVTFVNHDGGTWVFRREDGFKDVIKYGRIDIHENCFIGYGVILLPGIEIGPNSVVAAGAVVSKSVPPNSVAAGIPARVLMSRDEYAQRSRAACPNYDRAAYRKDKRAELLKLFPPPDRR